ncbi:MAG: GAF domain-containing protein [Alphaproteobacteria bacterium]|uniref:GAF domain-containing protein n=1 Tax=Candidatus Nitrobium versatile TaxID=2884831 RepID=A0A953J979_9BACT|nr:GAF domain-containing protein [Candidatus Nitrobium versatile]
MFGKIDFSILDSIIDGVYYINAEKQVEYWNRGVEALTGLTAGETKKRPCEEVVRYEDESGARIPAYEYPALLCLQSSKPVVKTLVILGKNGMKWYVEEHASPVFKGQKVVGAISLIRDNTRVFSAVETYMRNQRRDRLIPICAWCKKIRISEDSWEQIEKYFTDEGFGVFTHGMCPECAENIFEKKVYLESYQNICKAISSSLSLDEVLKLIVTNAVKVMNVKASMLRLLNKDTQKLEVAAYYGLSEKYVNKGPVGFDPNTFDALAGKAVTTYDIAADPDAQYRREAEEEGIRSILSIPVKFKKEVIGVLRMYTAEPVKYKAEDLKFMTAIAEQAAIAIMNARIFETTVSRAREYLRVFQEVTKAVSSTLRLSEVLNLIVSKLPEAMHLKAATIRLLDETRQKLELAAAHGLSARYLARGPVDIEENVQEALQTKPVAIYDVATDPRIHYQKEALEEGIKSILTLPIVVKGTVIGVLRLLTDELRHFSEEDISFSASLAEVCGTAIENARMYEQLKNDGLMMMSMVSEHLRPSGHE